MEIYIGDGEYAEAPGDDPADAYDAWLEQIAEEDDDYIDEQGLDSDDDDAYWQELGD